MESVQERFTKYSQNLVSSTGHTEFHDWYGREHYRMLGFLSTLFNNTHFIDIGTHTGLSAFALAFNPTNVVYTFDIVEKGVFPAVRSAKNIRFNLVDLFNEKTRQPWKDKLLSSPMIFLDVDPHNGIMEMSFYQFLKDNNYQGLLVCDDTMYFEDMINKFLANIEPKYRRSLTYIGHWSGTAIMHLQEDDLLDEIHYLVYRDSGKKIMVYGRDDAECCPIGGTMEEKKELLAKIRAKWGVS